MHKENDGRRDTAPPVELRPWAQASSEFDAFVHDFAVAQIQSKKPASLEDVQRQLWSAAEFDWHRQIGEVRTLTYARGKPAGDAGTYARLIEIASNAICGAQSRDR